MKKLLIIISCFLVSLMFVPHRSIIKDGGTQVYEAITYKVYDMHRMYSNDNGEIEYIEGTIIIVLGFEVFNNTTPYTEIV